MSEAQNGFQRNRSCTDAVFSLKLLIEKRREYNLETHILFLDYEKAFGSVLRATLFDILRNKNIPNRLLKAVVDIYDNNRIRIKFNSILSEYIPINQGVCQGCPLSPTLFNRKCRK
jgi:hypothetical protein